MYNTTLLDHFQNPRNVGELSLPGVMVEVTNPACGDILRLSVTVVEGRVDQVRYKTRGCTASIAAGSALTELLAGRDRTALGQVDAKAVEDAVGGLSPESRHAAVLCADGVKALLKRL
jgi:nitrogen fixation NifU-like protein